MDEPELDPKDFRYGIVGQEKGEEGTPHLQMYFAMTSPRTLKWMKKYVCKKTHWEIARGNEDENVTYCSKEGDFITFGNRSKQGKRSDLDLVRETALEEGMRAVTKFASYQQIQTAAAYLTYNEEKWDSSKQRKVVWIWGPSGSGKTRKATKMATELYGDDVYWKENDNKWFCGYDGHKCVIMDDYRSSNFKFNAFLRLIDRYPCRVEIKGGQRQWLPELIIITSIKKPDTFYCIEGEPQEQLLRRITQRIKMIKMGRKRRRGGFVEISDSDSD